MLAKSLNILGVAYFALTNLLVFSSQLLPYIQLQWPRIIFFDKEKITRQYF